MPEDNHRAESDPDHLRKIWEIHIERWKQSGQTQVAYCREHGLKPHQFTYWKRRFCRTGGDISFVPLRFSRNLPVAVTGSPFNLFTQNGFRIEVGAGFDPVALKQLINVVQSL